MEKGFFLYSGGSHQVSQMRVYKYIQGTLEEETLRLDALFF